MNIKNCEWSYAIFPRVHWCILRDICEHIQDNHPTGSEVFDTDLRGLVSFHNTLIERKETVFPHGQDYLKESISSLRKK